MWNPARIIKDAVKPREEASDSVNATACTEYVFTLEGVLWMMMIMSDVVYILYRGKMLERRSNKAKGIKGSFYIHNNSRLVLAE